jgi:Cof subfamily protein (haloacid dehalogenase superfamily)
VKIRALATDIDGTLTTSDGKIGEATLQALEAIASDGGLIVALTARPWRLLAEVEGLSTAVDFAVCDNGASVWEVREERLIAQSAWPEDALGRLLADLRAAIADVAVAVETTEQTIAERRFAELAGSQLDLGATTLVESLSEISSAINLMAIAGELSPGKLCGTVSPLAPRCLASHSGSAYAEVSPPGATKATGLAHLCELAGIQASEVVAFGDMPNDVPVLRWAGVGVAMANAHPEVLAAADRITLSNDEDGIAHCLQQLGRSIPQLGKGDAAP